MNEIENSMESIPGLYLFIKNNINKLSDHEKDSFISYSNNYLLQLLTIVKKIHKSNSSHYIMAHEFIFDTENVYDIYNHSYSDNIELIPIKYVYGPQNDWVSLKPIDQLNNYLQIYVIDEFHKLTESSALLRAQEMAMKYIDDEMRKLKYWLKLVEGE